MAIERDGFLITDDGKKIVGVRNPDNTDFYFQDQPSLQSALRVVADRCFLPHDTNDTNKQTQSSSYHVATSNITSLSAAFPNFQIISGVETGPGGSASLHVGLELIRTGQIIELKFDKKAITTIPNGGMVWSDLTPVNISQGEPFRFRSWFAGSTHCFWYAGAGAGPSAGSADVFAFGPTTPDLSQSGTIVSGGTTGLVYGPCAIVGTSATPCLSAMILGDSRASGLQETVDYSLRTGPQARSFSKLWATGNYARPGDRVQQWADGTLTHLQSIARNYTDVVIAMGINDLNAGTTAAQLVTHMTKLVNKFKGNRITLCTIEPITTSSDSWATVANQTPTASNAERVIYNNLLRRGVIPGVHHIADIADVAESSRDSGRWVANGTANYATADGLHGSTAVAYLIAKSKVVLPY